MVIHSARDWLRSCSRGQAENVSGLGQGSSNGRDSESKIMRFWRQSQQDVMMEQKRRETKRQLIGFQLEKRGGQQYTCLIKLGNPRRDYLFTSVTSVHLIMHIHLTPPQYLQYILHKVFPGLTSPYKFLQTLNISTFNSHHIVESLNHSPQQ